MSTFDIRQDSPGLLRAEAINVTLKFERTGETTGRVSWNIPTPAAGCTAATQAYCGILITIDNQPASIDKIPANGTVYSSDPTASQNLFAGDKLGTAFIVGAFYNDRTTTFFDITGLQPNTPYYVSGFPMDCQYRYFVEGVHAYSLDYTNRGTDSTYGTQVVVLNPGADPMGIKPTDYTGLMPGITYDFTIQLGATPKPQRPLSAVDCVLDTPKYTVSVDGTFAQTYQELVNAINRYFATLQNCPQGPQAPNTGAYYWNNTQKKLFQWNGSAHVEVPVIVEASAPSTVVVGTYWYNTTTHALTRWDGTSWASVTVITYGSNPAAPTADTSYWFDGTTLYVWNGNTWCELTTVIQTTDPSLPPVIADGSYWLDTNGGVLYRWNSALDLWTNTTAIEYDVDPNALPDGTYWFDESSNKLFTRTAGSWVEETNLSISESAPGTPAAGKFWYNPTTGQLFQRNGGNTAWVEQDVLAFPADPTQRHSCELWWNTTTDVLSVWNSLTNVWVPVTHFYQQSVDPTTPPVQSPGSAWYDPTTSTMYVWNGNCYVATTFINWPTNPINTITDGTVWHNTTNGKWYVRASSAWTEFDPIDSPNDPRNLPTGTMWFNTSTQGLQQWNGASWVAITYSTTPLTPQTGSCWFDTVTHTLKQWNGLAYVAGTPIARVEIDCNGNLLFTDTNPGSASLVRIADGTLFAALDAEFTIHKMSPGTDGASDQPSYSELGIGTDGSDAARLALQMDIRYELGYPVQTVELSKEQMDYAIDRALSEIRARSGISYKRGFFFMNVPANNQTFFLTNKISGMNKIVDVMGVYRLTSAFVSSAHGAGVYGQIVMQHLYNMGTFDMLSYHLMADYTKLMEILFAGRITFTWNEQTRALQMHHRFSQSERMVCIEATTERTEQDLMTDRYLKPWVRRYAAAVCRLMLAEIRGKFSTLPGAGGSVSLNAAELRQAAQTEIDACLEDIDMMIADKPDEYGVGSAIVFG